MPRLAIDYSKAQIYRIVCKNPKITDCFMMGTIPIYYGIKNIGEYHSICITQKNKQLKKIIK